jgi:hypothetical protein
MEKLFSEQDLLEIEGDAFLNLNEYLGNIVVNGRSNEKTIITISKKNQLIFVEGNASTGYEHLRERHVFFSFKNYWIEEEEKKYRLDKPSKFHPKMMPIIDYIKVADSIFDVNNKNITKNNKPNIFDKYTGLSADVGVPIIRK